MDPIDIVYLVRGGRNEELRWSLRSIAANLPHGRVWTFGGQPPEWITGVNVVKVPPTMGAFSATTAALRVVAHHAGVSGRFLLFNDDFFIMRRVREMPVVHRGPIPPIVGKERRTAGTYNIYLDRMREVLIERGFGTLCYELHVPMPMDRDRLAEVFDMSWPTDAFARHKRTAYGNVHAVGGTMMRDCKVRREPDFGRDRPFLSTSDSSFHNHPVGRYIRAAFPTPSRYER